MKPEGDCKGCPPAVDGEETAPGPRSVLSGHQRPVDGGSPPEPRSVPGQSVLLALLEHSRISSRDPCAGGAVGHLSGLVSVSLIQGVSRAGSPIPTCTRVLSCHCWATEAGKGGCHFPVKLLGDTVGLGNLQKNHLFPLSYLSVWVTLFSYGKNGLWGCLWFLLQRRLHFLFNLPFSL